MPPPRARYLLLLLLAGGCTRPMVLPPSVPVLQEPAQVLPEGGVAARLGAGAHGAVFGPGVWTVQGTLRHRLEGSGPWELSLRPSLVVVDHGWPQGCVPEDGAGTPAEEGCSSRFVWGAQVGFKHELTGWLAVHAGLGSVLHPSVFALSPETAVLFTTPPAWVQFYATARGFATVPLSASEVRLGYADGELVRKQPETTLGVVLESGVRVGVGERRRAGDYPVALLLGLDYAALWSRDDTQLLGLNAAVEASID